MHVVVVYCCRQKLRLELNLHLYKIKQQKHELASEFLTTDRTKFNLSNRKQDLL